jgi:hypothetical protein
LLSRFQPRKRSFLRLASFQKRNDIDIFEQTLLGDPCPELSNNELINQRKHRIKTTTDLERHLNVNQPKYVMVKRRFFFYLV